MATDAFPLAWPEGWPRTPDHQRQDATSRFRRSHWDGGYKQPSMHAACERLVAELRRLGAEYITVSSNVTLRADGMPRSGQRIPDDPGVAVYFELAGTPKAMARDAFHRPEHNATSLALAVEGMRQLDRHGGGVMIHKAFSGFDALPAPTSSSERHWTQVLGVSRGASPQKINQAFREKTKACHPDAGGSEAAFQELVEARATGLKAAGDRS